MLAEDYDLRGLELKECRKRLKRIEVQQTQNAGLSPEEAEETTREYREAILKQERELSKVREENRLLYEQLYEKAAKTKELEQLLSRGHSGCKVSCSKPRTKKINPFCSNFGPPWKVKMNSSKRCFKRKTTSSPPKLSSRRTTASLK